MLTSYKDWGGVFQAAARAVLREWEETLYYAPSNELLKVSSFVQHCPKTSNPSASKKQSQERVKEVSDA